ncbi:hypothetical protein M422DRAFT_255209 [Sphaerobolus stellatus SS14]|uniref:Uncharacterized protein n=1 Tax=Sphaerobolus stellatus (strain SS14) TaxID=990650 RepID=A0A0C9VTK7_SPHS4|nr:hypothetical protein M422DRAFT_255209 [Sphaerobolus stellatus SS14]
MEEIGNVTILAPFGSLILRNDLQAGEEDEEPELDTQTPSNNTQNAVTTMQPMDHDLEPPDLEDLINSEGVPADNQAAKTNPHFLRIGGHLQHKSSILKQFFDPIILHGPGSIDQLKRV